MTDSAPTGPERLRLPVADAVELDAELLVPDGATVGVVLCHPHPQYGGDMRSLVVSELFGTLPAAGCAVLRFDFRGVGTSTGSYDGGDGERLDVLAAVHALRDRVPVPLVAAGWSFGADMALSVRDPLVDAWVGIAPPLRFGHDLAVTGADPRPKLLLLAEHDELRDPAEVIAATDGWQACTVETIGGASHFFVGRTTQLRERVAAWLAERIVA